MSGSADVVVRGLGVAYDGRSVVHEVDLDIVGGTILAVVGESGCGKSSTALALCRLLPSNATTRGSAIVDGVDLLATGGSELRARRGTLVGYVPQSSAAALNPVRSVGTHLRELFRLRGGAGRAEARRLAAEALREVEITDPERVLRLHQHELSGGMRQRVAIAMALALRPRFLIADEPTTALDTTVQHEILALARRLCDGLGTTIVWITHDLGVVGAIADDVAVMYAGRVVEQAPARELFEQARHPYTRALLASHESGRIGANRAPFAAIVGQPPMADVPNGCAFHPRCPAATDRCTIEVPTSVRVGPGHVASCHLVEHES
jgi:oligopeptide/dipeptide ABC transporter ATP-binding protein